VSPDISLICTVYNEEDSIRELLQSVLEQNRKPEEAVFVDGGSTDNTQNILEEYSEEHDLIRFEVEDGANISEGRNRAIELAENDHIVGTDGGCILKENWCREMEKAFEDGNNALTGLFEPIAGNTFETVQGELRAGHFKPENVSEGQPPSARSIGFTKQVWRDSESSQKTSTPERTPNSAAKSKKQATTGMSSKERWCSGTCDLAGRTTGTSSNATERETPEPEDSWTTPPKSSVSQSSSGEQ